MFGTLWSRISLEKIFLDARETKCWTNIFSYSHYLHFCHRHVSLRLFHLCPRVFGKVSTFSTDSWWHFEDSCFRKDTYFQIEYTLRMYALSRFWLHTFPCRLSIDILRVDDKRGILDIVMKPGPTVDPLLRLFFFTPNEHCGAVKSCNKVRFSRYTAQIVFQIKPLTILKLSNKRHYNSAFLYI